MLKNRGWAAVVATVCVAVIGAGCAAPTGGETFAAESAADSTSSADTTQAQPTTTAATNEPPTTSQAPSPDDPIHMWTNGIVAVAADGTYAFDAIATGTPLQPGQYAATYDADTLTSNVVSLEHDGTATAIVWTGRILGGPDFPDPFMQGLFVDQAAAAEGVATFGASEAALERPAFETTDPRDNSVVTIDDDSWLAVSYRHADGSSEFRKYTVVAIAPDRSVLDLSTTVAKAAPVTNEAGFEQTTIEAVSGLLPYQLHLPTWMPDGFTLSNVVYAESPVSAVAGTRHVVALEYRYKTAQITVTFRSLETQEDWTDDPWDEGLEDQDVPGLEQRGDCYVAPPHIWETHGWGVVGDAFVTISGAASTDAIWSIFDGLK